jgi:hypothetical protein
MNKKAQVGLIGLYDASELPKWILYPLMFLICLILLVVIIIMILFIVSWFNGDANFIPIRMFGYYGMPIMIGSYQTHSSECYVNGIKINCSDFNGDEHFCNNGKCEMNGVCPSPNSNMTVEDCIKKIKEKNGMD